MWPTPQAFDAQRGPISEERYQKKLGGPNLISEIRHREKMFPTPTTQDAANNAGKSQYKRNSLPLNAEVGGSLNPDWVEWLQGYPLGFTNPISQE